VRKKAGSQGAHLVSEESEAQYSGPKETGASLNVSCYSVIDSQHPIVRVIECHCKRVKKHTDIPELSIQSDKNSCRAVHGESVPLVPLVMQPSHCKSNDYGESSG